MSTSQSRIEFERIELTLGNVREKLTDIQSLAADIKEKGLLNPLTVRHRKLSGGYAHELPDGRKVHDRYELVAGNRRHAAIALIREDDPEAFAVVPVTLFKGNDVDVLFVQLAENIQRRDLSPLEIANAVQKLRAKELPIETIAERLACSREWIRQLLKMRESCAEEVLHAVGKGELTMASALDLAALDQEQQIAVLESHKSIASTNGKREARKATRRAAGRVVRPSTKEIRERVEKYAESNAKMAPTIRKVLSWVLGEGDWL